MEPGKTFIVLADPRQTTAVEADWLMEHILSEDERTAVNRFVKPQDRHDRAVSRALVRLALSHYFPVAPRDWQFHRDKNQKPFIAAPEAFSRIQFSLSHTRDAIALLVSTNPEAGVDVEKIETKADLPAVARQVFSVSELSALDHLSDSEWARRFFNLWTLKESYVKARGLGLALPLKSISFETDACGETRVKFGPDIADRPDDWQFWSRQISPDHILSAAIRLESSQRTDVILQRARICTSAADASIEFNAG